MAISLASVLAEHGAEDVLVLDVAVQSGWTDYFVVATATSTTHMKGLLRFLDERAESLGATRFNKPSIADDEEWLLVDLGDYVLHIMSARARTFYELEKLWFQSTPIPVRAPSADTVPR
jgi:ribosome-associated protein